MLEQDYISERIVQLRQNTGESAREMSIALGQAENYINHIENKKFMPSIESLLNICEYLQVSPRDFFEEENKYPAILNTIIANLKRLDEDKLNKINGIIQLIADAKS